MSEPTISGNNARSAPSLTVKLLMALPLVVFAALAAIFWFRLGDGDPSRIPSALIGRAAPQTPLPALEGLASNGAPVVRSRFQKSNVASWPSLRHPK